MFNLRSAFPYLIDGSFPTPCHQCVVIENGDSIHLRTLHLCTGSVRPVRLFFVAEYTLLFKGNPRIVLDMLKTYLKYI